MSRRVCLVLFVAAGLVASSCAGDESVEPGGGSDDEVDVPALIGIERNVANGARRVDTTIDPDELEPPPPPRSTIGELPIPCGPSKETPLHGDTPGLTADSIRWAFSATHASGCAPRESEEKAHSETVKRSASAACLECTTFMIGPPGLLVPTSS